PPPPIFPEQDADEEPPSMEELQRAFGTPPASAEHLCDMPLSPTGASSGQPLSPTGASDAQPLSPPAASGTQPLSPLRERGWGEVASSAGENFLRAIQLYNAYLVIETPEGMLVIDQHALHERILFEQFKRRIREGPLQAQRLLTPEPVELTMEQ